MKYIAYCRKSRDEADKQVLSIEAQIAELQEFAKREKIEIVEFVEEAKTAKAPGREKFSEVIQKLERGLAQGIIAWHPDRLARNSIDGGKIIYLLDTGKIKDLKFPTFWFENTPQGKFMLNIAFGQSKYYIDNLSENVRRGLRQKIRNGVWPHKPTYGYVNNPKTRGIDVDPFASSGIIKAYEAFCKGDKTFTDISKLLFKCGLQQRNGKPLHINEVRKILSDKFYIGIMKFKGEYHPGTHKLFIPKDLFQKVQEELKWREAHHNKSFGFPFLGLMKCSECGASITAEKHTKFYKGTNRRPTYVYYRCTKKMGPCSQKMIKGELLEEQLREIVASCALPESWIPQWLSWVERYEISEKELSASSIQKFQDEIVSLDKKLNILLDGFLENIVDSDTYKRKKNEIFEEKILLEEQIAKLKA
jgi:DNA invertase Pin-like site-specific DNA recombinase